LGRKKIDKFVLFATPEKNDRFTIYKMINDSFQRLATFPYEVWETEYIYDMIRNELFEKEKIQLALQLSDNIFVYRSCNEGKLYTVTVNDHEIDCTCQWATMYVKTGLHNGKLCHHVNEVKNFLGL
jgi:hypothetical protein